MHPLSGETFERFVARVMAFPGDELALVRFCCLFVVHLLGNIVCIICYSLIDCYYSFVMLLCVFLNILCFAAPGHCSILVLFALFLPQQKVFGYKISQ